MPLHANEKQKLVILDACSTWMQLTSPTCGARAGASGGTAPATTWAGRGLARASCAGQDVGHGGLMLCCDGHRLCCQEEVTLVSAEPFGSLPRTHRCRPQTQPHLALLAVCQLAAADRLQGHGPLQLRHLGSLPGSHGGRVVLLRYGAQAWMKGWAGFCNREWLFGPSNWPGCAWRLSLL